MNLYVRYFDKETLVHNAEEVIDFLSHIDGIGMNNVMAQDVRDYVESNFYYPKRYKVRPRVYFIIIKTEAATMEDFKAKKAVHSVIAPKVDKQTTPVMARLRIAKEGWYEGSIAFKRVLQVPGTGKFQYKDTTFVARCKASSGLDCYNRIVGYLKERVDPRSQFPSVKGKNFKFTYLGACKSN